MTVAWSAETFYWTLGDSIFYRISEILNLFHVIVIVTLFIWRPKVEAGQNRFFLTLNSLLTSLTTYLPLTQKLTKHEKNEFNRRLGVVDQK